ncbi:hypothetical protein pm083_45080 [Escherichia coli]|nr:hypothetical protein pm083_45080 [Escherichia coli]
MFRDVFIHNSLGVIFMLLAIVALVVNFYMVRFSKKNYIVIGCLLSLLLWSCIIILIGDYLSFFNRWFSHKISFQDSGKDTFNIVDCYCFYTKGIYCY